MSRRTADWQLGTSAQFALYDLISTVESTWDCDVSIGDPWVNEIGADRVPVGFVLVAVVFDDTSESPYCKAATVGRAPMAFDVIDFHVAALHALQSLYDGMLMEPIPFVPTPVVK